MISLKINNTTVSLLAGQSLSFDINNLIFDTEFLQGSRSSNFRIVVDDTSQDIFGLPEKIASKTKPYSFTEFNAQILFNGIVLYSGKFLLRKATNFYYEGNFQFGISDIAPLKDTFISEIIGDEAYIFESDDVGLEMKKTLEINNNPVVFPVVKLGNKFYNKYKNNNYLLPYQVGDDGYPVPFIRIIFILELVLQKLGYHIITPNWTQDYPDVRKLIFFNNRKLNIVETITEEVVIIENPKGDYTTIIDVITLAIGDNNMKYSDYLPEITLSNFIKSIKNLLGLYFQFDSTRKTVGIYFLNDIIANTDARNITVKASPKHIVTPYNENGIVFQFQNYDKDKLFSYLEDYPQDLSTFNQLPEVEKKTDLPASNITPQKTICLVRAEHRYFINTYEGWQEWCYPWLDYRPFGNKRQKGEQTISTSFSPIASNKGWNFHNKKGKIIKDTSGPYPKIGITIDANQVYIKPANVIFKESEVYQNQYRYPVELDTQYYTRLTKYYRDDEEVAYTRVAYGNFILPESDFSAVDNELPPIRCLIFHGLQSSPVEINYNVKPFGSPTAKMEFETEMELQSENGGLRILSKLYPMASSEAYDSSNLRIAQFALRWEGQLGLVETFWANFLSLYELARKFEVEAAFNLEDLRKFKPTQKVKIREAQFIIEKMETKLSADGVDFTKLDLIRIGSETNKPPIPPIPKNPYRTFVDFDFRKYGCEQLVFEVPYNLNDIELKSFLEPVTLNPIVYKISSINDDWSLVPELTFEEFVEAAKVMETGEFIYLETTDTSYLNGGLILSFANKDAAAQNNEFDYNIAIDAINTDRAIYTRFDKPIELVKPDDCYAYALKTEAPSSQNWTDFQHASLASLNSAIAALPTGTVYMTAFVPFSPTVPLNIKGSFVGEDKYTKFGTINYQTRPRYRSYIHNTNAAIYTQSRLDEFTFDASKLAPDKTFIITMLSNLGDAFFYSGTNPPAYIGTGVQVFYGWSYYSPGAIWQVYPSGANVAKNGYFFLTIVKKTGTMNASSFDFYGNGILLANKTVNAVGTVDFAAATNDFKFGLPFYPNPAWKVKVFQIAEYTGAGFDDKMAFEIYLKQSINGIVPNDKLLLDVDFAHNTGENLTTMAGTPSYTFTNANAASLNYGLITP